MLTKTEVKNRRLRLLLENGISDLILKIKVFNRPQTDFGQAVHNRKALGIEILFFDLNAMRYVPGPLRYIASGPVSPVLTRTACSIGTTKILPSPILPVCAASRMASTT